MKIQISIPLLLAAWFSLGLMTSPTVAAAKDGGFPYETEVPIERIAPTQMEIGIGHVGYSIAKIQKRAVAREIRSGKSDANLLEAILSRPLPGMIDPDGRIRIRDGHHWATAVTKVVEQNPALASRIRVKVVVEADFRGKSWGECAKAMYENRVGYFTKEVREKFAPFELLDSSGHVTLPEAKLEEMYTRYLPTSLPGLRNNPGRSALGMALERMGIEPELGLEDYIEFYMAEDFADDLEKSGVDLSRFLSLATIDGPLLSKVEAIIATRPEVVHYLLSRTRPGLDHAQAQRMILEKVNEYRMQELGLKPLTPASLPARLDRRRVKTPSCAASALSKLNVETTK